MPFMSGKAANQKETGSCNPSVVAAQNMLLGHAAMTLQEDRHSR